MRASVEFYDPHFPPADLSRSIAYTEAETFEQARQAFVLMGAAIKGPDGFFYNSSGQRVVIRWLDDATTLIIEQ